MTELAEPKRQRAKRGERRCKYVYVQGDQDGAAGEVHGVLLTPENSYRSSVYCKTHHNRVMLRNRQHEPGRSSNIARVKRYNQRHPEKVAANKKASRERLARGERHPTRGRPPVIKVLPGPSPAATALAETLESATAPELMELAAALVEPAEWFSGAFKPTNSPKFHLKGQGTMSECKSWRAPNEGFTELPADDPRLCAPCKRRRRARKSPPQT